MSSSSAQASGSRTITQTEPAEQSTTSTVILKKKPKPKGVKWDESTAIDNENMGKKSSKVCCIYHKPRAFGESDSEDECDHAKNAYDRMPKNKK